MQDDVSQTATDRKLGFSIPEPQNDVAAIESESMSDR